MPCIGKTLVVEYDENNHMADWKLVCEGTCPEGETCKSRRLGPENLPDGGERYTHRCACKPEGDADTGQCNMIVFEDIRKVEGQTITTFKGKCIGRCPHSTVRCRPVVVKE